jgi:hypothetical protein
VSDLLKAALVPITNIGVLLTMIMFWLMLSLASAAGLLGIWLSVVIVPALFRYLTSLVEDMGSGRDPKPPGSEFFRWIGETWSLFPLVVVLLSAWAGYAIYGAAGSTPMILFIVCAGFVYPAILGVLAITHSPLQSVNPSTLIPFIGRVGFAYVIAPIFLFVVAYLSLFAKSVPYIALLVELFLIFSLHTVIGKMIAPHKLIEDVHIPDALVAGESEIAADLESSRIEVLTHAYGFASRGNREGGFKHITDWIAKDPDVVQAWDWFFNRMMQWEDKQHAMFFAQLYIHDMLQHGENIPALKVIMRCRLIDETFKPLAEDIPAAIAAAENSGNIELATVLKHY